MKKIAFFNQKGGVGKTSACVNIAGCLCKIFDKRVLVVDCDSQGNATSYLLTENTEPIEYTLTDLFAGVDVKFSEIVKPVIMTLKQKKEPERIGIDVIPISRAIDRVNIKELTVLKDFLAEQEDNYDYCLLDCPPHLSDMSLNALCAADFVVVPSQADPDSLSGYSMLVDSINEIRQSGYNVGVEILGVMVNNITPHLALDRYMYQMFRDGFKKMLLLQPIKRSTDVAQARFFGKPLCYYKPNSPITEDYISLTEEIISRTRVRRRG